MTPSHEVGTQLSRAVSLMAGKPGVRLAEPATPEMIRRAEERLGRALPYELRVLLSITNGLSVEYGLRRILGLERSDSPDLVDFNRTDAWKYAWPEPLLENLLVFKIDYQLNFIGYEADDETLVEGMLPLAGSIERSKRDLTWKIERGWTRLAEGPLHPEDAQVKEAVGEVPWDMGVYLGKQYFFKGIPDLTELHLRPLIEVLRMSGGLSTDADRLPPEVTVLNPLRETDDMGRERWRWLTDQDLAGLTEAIDPDQPISHFTVDGQIPRVNGES